MNLSNEEFLAAVIKAYSGCSDETALRSLASEVLKFNEGYTLIARLVGEELRRSNCLVSDAQAMLKKTHGDASAFLIHWINDYLGIFERGKPIPNRIRALAEVLAVREPFKADLSPGDYIATPYFMDRLVYWTSNSSEGLSDEQANWLVVKHEDLLEDAITMIVKATKETKATEPECPSKALEPWSEYGKFKGEINNVNDAIKYINERYSKELGEEFKNISSDCWNALILVLGSAWIAYSLEEIIEYSEGVTGLMPIVNSALKVIRNGDCNAVRLLIINNKMPLLTWELLYAPAMGLSSFVLDALAEGRINHVRNAFNEFINAVEEGRKKNRGLYPIEGIYAFGLAVLTAYADKRGIKEYASDDGLKAKALEVATWAIQHITNPVSIIYTVDLMSNLSDSSLNDWAVILAAATNALIDNKIDNENELSELSEFIDDLWAKRNRLNDWGRAYLIDAMVNTLWVKKFIEPEQVCKIFKEKILNAINGIRSNPLRVLSSAIAYSRLASVGGADCGIDLKQEITELIKTLEGADQAAWLRDEQLIEYLRRYGLVKPEDALRRLINEDLSHLYHAIGKLSVDNADLDDAIENFEKARNDSKDLEDWPNYIISYGKLVRAKVLRSSSIDEFIRVGKEFGDVFNEALDNLEPNAAGLTALASSLVRYLVYLAIVGDKARFTELMGNYDWLLQYLSPDNKVVTMLFLKWLGMDVEAPKAEELINAIRSSLDPIFLPALRRVLGINVDCRKECSRLSNAEICNMACTAADGDKHALKELIEFIRGIKPDLADALANFSPRAIVQALAPKSSLGMLALILNALLSNDYESAKAIAIVGEYASNVRILKQLFGDLHKAIDEGNVDGIKLALAKLYYLQV